MQKKFLLVWFALAILIPALAPAEESASTPLHTNRLIDSANPYLLAHAHNPVDWYPWGREAWDKAKRENKLIFLSIGYSTCYWCFVAEKTIYSNPDIARLMNDWFVNIKVDREERPDVDDIYMLATRVITKRGGWPNNLFLTPDLKPFFAGSYFKPEDDDFGRPGFPNILRAIHQQWVDEPRVILHQAEQVHAGLRKASVVESTGAALAPAQWLSRAREEILRTYDTEYGGFRFGTALTKFPHVPMLDLLLADYRRNAAPASLAALTHSLDQMAAGGIFDHLAGGFHRYSTDRSWSVPHFEKMLFDNAQLLRLYAQAYSSTGAPRFRVVAESIAQYLQSRLLAPDGGFYTAEDATVAGDEGASYLWSESEIQRALGASESTRFWQRYRLAPLPEKISSTDIADEPRGVLRLRVEPAPAVPTSFDGIGELALPRAQLLALRNQRPHPNRDEKLIVAQNALAIEAFAIASRVIQNHRYREIAEESVERIWTSAFDPAKNALAHHLFRGERKGVGYLEDYAFLGNAMVTLYDLTQERKWLERGTVLAQAIADRFRRADGGLQTTQDASALLLAPEDRGDGAYPSGTAGAIRLWQRLRVHNPSFGTLAEEALRAVAPRVAAAPAQWPALLAALDDRAEELPLAPAQSASEADAEDDTATHLKASYSIDTEKPKLLRVHLEIAPGYHVNANPASQPELIATTVKVRGVEPVAIVYPRGRSFKPAFAPEGIDIYEDTIEVTIQLAQTASDLVLEVTAQACTDQVCLLPATISVPAAVREVQK